MGNERVCGTAVIRREVCRVLDPTDCSQDREEKEVCVTKRADESIWKTATRKLKDLCAGYYSGMGPANREHKKCWSYRWEKK